MTVSAPLPSDVHAVVVRARRVVADVCDGLRVLLLDVAGEVATHHKDDGSPVTDADLEADRRIHAAIIGAFPDHAIISEEAGTVWDGRDWAWIVDPIDGTSNFTAGIPYWCVSIALAYRGVPIYGCIEAPPLRARFEAVRGEGATRDGQALQVHAPVDFRSGAHRHVPVVVTAGTIRRAEGTVRLNARILGSAALDLAMVASGHVVAAYQRVPKVWDMAAGALLVEEAGGVYVSFDEPLLPLRPATDLATVAAAGVAGADEAWLRDLVAAL